jgi:hypothetical protein
MVLNGAVAVARLTSRGQNGKLQSAITGEETDDELRAMARWFITACPTNLQHPRSPFRILSRLYHGSLEVLIKGMTRAALLGLFECEFEVRNAPAAPNGGNETKLVAHSDLTP